ncbi:MAG: S8 family serine peptidase, partial [Gemmataceae bacterium]|nr:S8 family serine peptidase [Gemmataceae bacterium]
MNRRTQTFARRPNRLLRVEHLEDRTVPTTGAWLPGADAVAGPVATATQQSAAQGNQTQIAGEWIIRVDGYSGPRLEQAAAAARRADAAGGSVEVVRQLGLDGTFLVRGPGDAAAAWAAASGLGKVRSVEPNYSNRAIQLVPNDARFGELYGMENTGQTILGVPGVPGADINATGGWDRGTGTSQVVMASIDTGVDYTHPDLYLNIWINEAEIPASIASALADVDGDGITTFYDLNDPVNIGPGKIEDWNGNGRIDGGDILNNSSGWEDGADNDGNGFADDFVGWDFVNDDNDPMDGHGHGTHTAGTMAAIGDNGIGVAGVNWRGRVQAIKWIDDGGFGDTSDAVDSVNYVADTEARLSNNSWQIFENSAALEDAIAHSGDNGQLFVVAAQNWATDNDAIERFPTNYPLDNIISVAASTNTDDRAFFSNWGLTQVDVAAPGLDVLSTVPYGTGYDYFSGTSMASPHVAGIAGLAWSINPGATAAQVKAAILGGVEPVDAFRVDGPTPIATGGRVDLVNTLNLMGLSVTRTDPAVGSTVSTRPVQYDVYFSEPVVPGTVQASDFTVNGVAATGVRLQLGNTRARFTFTSDPVTVEGLQTMYIPEGVIDSAERPLSNLEFTGTFRYDTLPLAITGSDPAGGALVTMPFTDLTLTFNEPVDPASVDAGDLALSAGSATGVTVAADGLSATFTLDLPLVEQTLSVAVGAGAIADVFGNPNPAGFSSTYELDFGTVAFPVPLAPAGPAGTQVYHGRAAGRVGVAGDEDGFTLAIDGGQLLTPWVTPNDAGLQPILTVFDSGDVAVAILTAPAPGQPTPPTALDLPAGTYRMVVGGIGGTAGGYSIRALLNATAEAESFGGPDNGTTATAERLTFRAAGPGGLAAVRGRVSLPTADIEPNDWFDNPQDIDGGSWSLDANGDIQDSTTVPHVSIPGTGNYTYDFYKFTVDAAGAVGTFDIDYTSALDSYLYLYTADGSYITETDDAGIDPGSSTTLDSFLSWTFDSPGEYLIIVASYPGSTVPAGASYTLQVSLTGHPLGGPADTADVYAVDLAAGEALTLSQTGPGGLELLGPDGSVLAIGAGGSNLGDVIDGFVAPAAGTYYARVAGGNGEYTLVAARALTLDREPNGSPDDAQPVAGGAVAGRAQAGGELFDLPGTPVSGGFTLTGDRITLGINPDGSFINGATGIQFDGTEFVVPGSPVSSFSVAVDGSTFTNAGALGITQLTDIQLEDLSSGSLRGMRMTGMAGDLRVERVVVFDAAATYATIATRLTNLSGGSMAGVASLENLDPDQDYPTSFATANDVVLGGEFVRATAAFGTPGLTIGLGSADSRRVVSSSGFFVTDPFQVINFPFDYDGAIVDDGINLAFDLGGLAAGASTSATLVMAFGTSAGEADATYSANPNGIPTTDTDWYAVTLGAGDVLDLATETPADGPGEFVNTLDPHLEVYDADGDLVATGVAGADGRNETVSYAAPAAGTYRVRVSAEGDTAGEYVLSVSGASATPAPFVVAGASIPDGAFYRADTVPATVTVDFNDGLLLSSVDAGDLTVDGVAATGVTVVDGDTVVFDLPGGLGDGLHTLTIAAGSILDLQGTPVDEFTRTFTVDATLPTVVGTSPAPGAVVPTGSVSIDVTFSEPMLASNLDLFDVALYGLLRGTYTFPDSISFDASGTVLSVSYSGLVDDSYRLVLFAGYPGGPYFTDLAGNPLDGQGVGYASDFFLDFAADADTVAFPTPLAQTGRLGSLVYGGSTVSTATFAGDTDAFTLALDANQTASVVVTPFYFGSVMVELVAPDGSVVGTATSPADGLPAVLSAAPAADAGTYTVRVTGVGSATGLYQVALTLNAAVEAEAYGGPANDTPATAEPVAGLTDLRAGPVVGARAAVQGAVGAPLVGAAFASENFDDGLIPGSITTYTSDPSRGRTGVANFGFFPNFTPSLFMDNALDDGVYAYNDATYTVDAGGRAVVNLSFDYFNFGDEPDNLPATYTDRAFGDGVSVSVDGVNWRTVLNANDAYGRSFFTWTGFSGVLQAADFGLAGFDTLYVRFSQYDNYATDFYTDGYTFDNIALSDVTLDADVYSFELAAGQTATVSAAGVLLDIVDAGGNVLAAGVPTLEAGSVATYTAPAAGTYYARVSGASAPYTLVLTTGLDQELGGNDSLATAQVLAGDGVLGSIRPSVPQGFQFTDSGWYRDDGFHDTTNQNYYAGLEFGTEYRNWFTFDLSGVTNTITAATLQLSTVGYVGSDPSETYTLFAVATPIADLVGGTGGLGAFDDLADGTPLGTITLTAFDAFTVATITLNADGVAYLNDHRGGQVALGGAITSIDGDAEVQSLFAFSGSFFDTRQLNLTFAPPEDWYAVDLTADQLGLRVQTSTPGDGSGEFVNLLDPRVELYDAGGNLVATGTDLADGRNEGISFIAPAAGRYYVRVTGESETTGEYVLAAVPLAAPRITVEVDDSVRSFAFRVTGGGWSSFTSEEAYRGSARVFDQDSGLASPRNVARWQMRASGPTAEVFVTWVARPENATNATYRIYDGTTLRGVVVVDQTRPPTGVMVAGARGMIVAQSLGVFDFSRTGTLVVTLDSVADGDVVADAVFDPPVGDVTRTGDVAAAVPPAAGTGATAGTAPAAPP